MGGWVSRYFQYLIWGLAGLLLFVACFGCGSLGKAIWTGGGAAGGAVAGAVVAGPLGAGVGGAVGGIGGALLNENQELRSGDLQGADAADRSAARYTGVTPARRHFWSGWSLQTWILVGVGGWIFVKFLFPRYRDQILRFLGALFTLRIPTAFASFAKATGATHSRAGPPKF